MTESSEPVVDAHPAKQPRSRRTLERLLQAAEEVLAREGLEGATVPAIARRARLSVGIVYRRFPDKDALMRAVYERFFARSMAANRDALDPTRWAGVPATRIVRSVVGGMVRGYEQHRTILRALLRYADAHPDPEFRRHAEALRGDAFARVGDLLLARRAEIRHPDPAAAIRFALTVVALALQGLVLPERRWSQPELEQIVGTGEQLGAELDRLVLGYLGLDADPEPVG
ncbi:MAG TPA: TetR/AcrR family transcriptional regulator [Gemmatimonadaceae bacterium]|nr:TetR/AcrR family transcriptional regulator [Gemmatimonadaceae bacterium]